MAESTTTRFLLPRWSAGADTGPERSEIDGAMLQVENKMGKVQQGTFANRPAASIAGLYYWVTGDPNASHNNTLWYSNGSSWKQVGQAYTVVPQAHYYRANSLDINSGFDYGFEMDAEAITSRHITLATDGTGKMTVAKGGRYFVSFQVAFYYAGSSSTRGIRVRLHVNGAQKRETTARGTGSGSSGTPGIGCRLATIIDLADNAQIEWTVRQDMGSASSDSPIAPSHSVIPGATHTYCTLVRIGR